MKTFLFVLAILLVFIGINRIIYASTVRYPKGEGSILTNIDEDIEIGSYCMFINKDEPFVISEETVFALVIGVDKPHKLVTISRRKGFGFVDCGQCQMTIEQFSDYYGKLG